MTAESTTPLTDKLHDDFFNFLRTSGVEYDDGLRDWVGPLTRQAVALCALHSQVCNGGFSQWITNGYARSDGAEVRRALEIMSRSQGEDGPSKITLRAVITALEAGEEPHAEDEFEDWSARLDALDGPFYAITDGFLADVESHLRDQSEKLPSLP